MDQHKKQQSAETLRQCIPLITEFGSDFGPTSYTVWYEYVKGDNPWLAAEIDARRRERKGLGPSETGKLFERLTGTARADVLEETRKAFSGLIGTIASTTAKALTSTRSFSSELKAASHSITRGDVMAAASTLSEQIHAYSSTLDHVNARLEQSTAEIDRLKEELRYVRELALTDPLTGLANRRVFEDRLAELAGQADEGGALTLLIADIDYFKRINDTHGHLLGDQVIRAIATILKSACVGSAIAARIGGEEFALILPGLETDAALRVAEVVRRSVESARIRRVGREETVASLTISCGVARYKSGHGAMDLIDRADRALYRAKGEGRNCVRLDSSLQDAPCPEAVAPSRAQAAANVS